MYQSICILCERQKFRGHILFLHTVLRYSVSPWACYGNAVVLCNIESPHNAGYPVSLNASSTPQPGKAENVLGTTALMFQNTLHKLFPRISIMIRNISNIFTLQMMSWGLKWIAGFSTWLVRGAAGSNTKKQTLNSAPFLKHCAVFRWRQRLRLDLNPLVKTCRWIGVAVVVICSSSFLLRSLGLVK